MPKVLKNCCPKVQQRYIMFVLTFGAMAVCYLDRQTYFKFLDNIVSRERRTHNQESSSICPDMISDDEYNLNNQVEFYWEMNQVKIITQCFYIGYLICLIPGGVIADMYGARVVMGLGVLLSSITTLLTPSLLVGAGGTGGTNMMIIRVFQGISQGLVIPAASVVVANWAPLTFRTTACGIVSSGMLFGWGYGYWQHELFHSYLTESWKWEGTFYVSGMIGFVWGVFWFCITGSYCSCSVHPRNHRCISQAELDFLKNGVEGIDHNQINRINPYIPWRSIFTSFPFLSLLAIHWSSSWMHYLALIHFEEYLDQVVGISEKLSNNSSTFAEFAMAPAAIFWGFVSDWLINNKYISRTANRKYFAFFANMLMIPCMLCILLVHCNKLAAVSLYVTFCFVRSPFYSSLRSNVIDLSPNHCGVLQGILSSSSAISALFIAESFNALVGAEPSNINKWWTMIGASCIMLVLLSLPYLWFASAEKQPWNQNQQKPRIVPSASQTSNAAMGS